MTTLTGPKKGDSATLPLPAAGQGRFLVGLSWTPKFMKPEVKVNIPALRDDKGTYDTFYFFKLPFHILRIICLSLVRLFAVSPAKGRGADVFDLDLFCYVFDRSMSLLHVVGPKNAEVIDPSRKVYHSGENQVGRIGETDAEQVFVETRDAPPEYHTFIFVVKSANRNSLGDIPDASVRLADSASNENLLQNVIAATAMPPGDAYGYVFCSVSREGNGWSVRNTDSFAGRAVDWNLLLPAIETVAR